MSVSTSLQQFASSRAVPLWGTAALTLAFVLVGGLSAIWAVVGFTIVALWTVRAAADVTAKMRAARIDEPQSPVSPTPSDDRKPIWRQMLDVVPDAALLLDARRRVLAANARMAEVQAVTRGDHVAQLRQPALIAAVELAMDTGAPQSFDVDVLLPVERHLAGTAMPLQTDEPESPTLLLVLRDRTESERLAEMRADFVANASHELRTPLASLIGFIETLQGPAKDDPEARDQFLAIMQQQSSRMSRLIDDLLSLSRIEMQEHVAPRETIDLAALVHETGTALRSLADDTGIELILHRAAAPVHAIGDRDELAQVAQNLIQNAIKYGKTGGKVELSVRRDAQRVILSVVDDGIGIAAQHLPRLTERFYRVNAKKSRERGGTGLGLAIVKHIVNRHRGELRIESRLDQGSTFTVILPAAPQA